MSVSLKKGRIEVCATSVLFKRLRIRRSLSRSSLPLNAQIDGTYLHCGVYNLTKPDALLIDTAFSPLKTASFGN